jgi:NAD(P)-dependent dehydrogenase (short-subunit alcohol dehydrogenase family)
MADDPHLEENWRDVLFTHKAGEPEDVAAVALFLASPESRQITGQAIVVDGGWVIHSPIPAGHPDIPPASSQLR